MKKDLSQVFPKDIYMGAIYISSLTSAQSLQLLQQNNIKSVLSAARNVSLTQVSPSLLKHIVLPAYDHPQFDISQFFESTFSFIEDSRKVGNVLVHCVAGISRSATIVAAYLIRKCQITTKNAISLLKKQRAQIKPNPGFMKQLQQYQAQILPKPERIPLMDIKQQMMASNASVNSFKGNSSNLRKRIATQSNTYEELSSQILTKDQASQKQKDQRQKKPTRRYSAFGDKLSSPSKTNAKIQRVKREMVSRQIAPSSRVKTEFSELLQSNIYKNKLRVLR